MFSLATNLKKKKKFEGDTEGGAAGFNRDLVALSLKFPRCSAFSFFLTALSELMPHFTFSPRISVVIVGIEHQKTILFLTLLFFSNEFLLYM